MNARTESGREGDFCLRLLGSSNCGSKCMSAYQVVGVHVPSNHAGTQPVIAEKVPNAFDTGTNPELLLPRRQLSPPLQLLQHGVRLGTGQPFGFGHGASPPCFTSAFAHATPRRTTSSLAWRARGTTNLATAVCPPGQGQRLVQPGNPHPAGR